MRRVSRIMIGALIAIALVVPASSPAVAVDEGTVSAAAYPDSDGNGSFATAASLPTTTAAIPGSVSASTDTWDVYYVDVAYGQKINMLLTGPAATDFDVFLFSSEATTLAEGELFHSWNEVYPEAFSVPVPHTGRYYIAVEAAAGAGSYSLWAHVADREMDDEIFDNTGALPASPVTGTIDPWKDQDDVYPVYLREGQSIRFRLQGPTTGYTDFDVYLFGPEALSVVADDSVHEADRQWTASEAGEYEATTSGIHYVDIQAWYRSGAYTFAYMLGDRSLMTFAGPASAAYAGLVTFKGSLTTTSGVPREGQTVLFQQRPYGKSTWSTISTASVDASGSYSFKARPVIMTYYRAYYPGAHPDLLSASASRAVKPRVYLSAPYAPLIARRNVAFTSKGTIKPRQAVGSKTVRIWAQRWERTSSGRYGWVTKRTFTATNSNYSTYSRYAARVVLPYSGKWRMQAVYGTTAKNAYTKGPLRYVTVR